MPEGVNGFSVGLGSPVIAEAYRRYASKEELLETLCADGLHRFIHVADVALVEEPDPWAAFARFIRGIVDADVHSLTVHLAGTFTPTPVLRQLADTANKRAACLFRRARSAGAIYADLHLNDLAMLFDQLAAIRVGDAERTRALRQRYLALQLDAPRPAAAQTRLPGPPPTSEELGARWIPAQRPGLNPSGAREHPLGDERDDQHRYQTDELGHC